MNKQFLNETAEHREKRLKHTREYHAKNKEKEAKQKKERRESLKTIEELQRREEKTNKKIEKDKQYEINMANKTEKILCKRAFQHKIYMNNIIHKFLEMYGNICAICGESEKLFLTLDHKKDDGYKYGKGRYYTVYKDAIKTYDTERYQILCFTCNERKNREKLTKELSSNRKTSVRLHNKFFEIYGNKCACCGHAEIFDLTLDHVKNNGKELRMKNGAGLVEYRVAVRQYDPETYQVLCWKCNLGKHRNGGTCPHKSKQN